MSKNVNVNGVDYAGVSQIQLNTTDGATALFKDVDEITDVWEGYQHTMQVAPIPYIIDQCEKATAKGTFAITSAIQGTTELLNTGLSSVHFLVIMLKNPVNVNTTDNGHPSQLVLVDVDNQYSYYLSYSSKPGKGCAVAAADGVYEASNMTKLSFDGGKVNVTHQYNGEAYSAFRSTNEYLWFAW